MNMVNSIENPLQFGTRKPPLRELYAKLFILLLFGVFCCVVGFYVAPLPLPRPKRSPINDRAVVPGDDVAVFTFSTFSPEERASLAELSARLSVPYFTPWGADERPALFFMWHLLYRSIKPDLEHFTVDLHNVTAMLPPKSTAVALSSTIVRSPISLTAANTTTRKAEATEKLQVVIHVVETEYGYITTSLARFFPETVVFSIVVKTNAARPYYVAARHRERLPAGTAAEKCAAAELVASKVERVLENPAAENVTESTQRLGMNRVPVSVATVKGTTRTTTTTTETNALGEVITMPPPLVSLSSSPRLFLCVPTNTFNETYFTEPVTLPRSVNYQVLLSPYIVLRTAKTTAQFDAILRSVFTRANVATFIALPWMWDDARVDGDGGEIQRHRAQVYAKELADFNRWYGQDEGYPLRVLQRALRVPEIESKYSVFITQLGAKRWSGARRELFRVELIKLVGAATSTATTTTTTTTSGTTTESPDNVTNAAEMTAASAPNYTRSLFGCAARRSFLQCAPRPQYASCERFSDHAFA